MRFSKVRLERASTRATLRRLAARWAHVVPLYALLLEFVLKLGIPPVFGCKPNSHAWAAGEVAVGAAGAGHCQAGLSAPSAVGVLISWGLGGGNMGLARWHVPVPSGHHRGFPQSRLSCRGKHLGQRRLLRLWRRLRHSLRRFGCWHSARLALRGRVRIQRRVSRCVLILTSTSRRLYIYW